MFETVEFTEENQFLLIGHAKLLVLAIHIFFDSTLTVLKSNEILVSFAQHYILEFRHLRG